MRQVDMQCRKQRITNQFQSPHVVPILETLLHVYVNCTDTVDAAVQVNMADSQSFPLNEPSV